MRAGYPFAVLLLAVSAGSAAAQAPARPAEPPVITCTSLANLRMVLRSVKDDAAAAIPIITDPKSDLGCSVLDQKAVTGLADHVALNGSAYDCLALQATKVCHWTVAGAVTPPAPGRPQTPAAPPPTKTKR